jgi:hypothetical protein
MRALVLTFVTAIASGTAWAAGLSCPPDAVPVGNVCVDKYEASVWQVDPTTVAGRGLIRLIQGGRVTLDDLTDGGATHLGIPLDTGNCTPGFPARFPDDGQWSPLAGSNPPSPGVYAVSVAGVRPTACITWFQAAQACALSGKRLLTNLEWQDAGAGTPDPGILDNGSTTCATNSADPANTGARTSCRSRWGGFDMVGNVDEWVAEWVPRSTDCGDWSGSDDLQCLAGAATTGEPGALLRGGDFKASFLDPFGLNAGPLSVRGSLGPSSSDGDIGFRCAR